MDKGTDPTGRVVDAKYVSHYTSGPNGCFSFGMGKLIQEHMATSLATVENHREMYEMVMKIEKTLPSRISRGLVFKPGGGTLLLKRWRTNFMVDDETFRYIVTHSS
jgi:hypothetical protein